MAGFPVSIRDFGLMGDPTGLVQRGQIILDDDMADGPQGWRQLTTQNLREQGTVSYIHYRGKPCVIARTPNIAGAAAMAIGREVTVIPDARYLVEMLVSLHDNDTADPLPTPNPSWVEFALDSAKFNAGGTRRYFSLKHDIAGLLTGTPQSFAITLSDGLGGATYYTLPFPPGDAVFAWPNNENKHLPTYVAFVVNAFSGKYEGVQIGSGTRYRWGVLSNKTDITLSDQGTAFGQDLPRFGGGFNPLISLSNRPSGSLNGSGTMSLFRNRVTALNQGNRPFSEY